MPLGRDTTCRFLLEGASALCIPPLNSHFLARMDSVRGATTIAAAPIAHGVDWRGFITAPLNESTGTDGTEAAMATDVGGYPQGPCDDSAHTHSSCALHAPLAHTHTARASTHCIVSFFRLCPCACRLISPISYSRLFMSFPPQLAP